MVLSMQDRAAGASWWTADGQAMGQAGRQAGMGEGKGRKVTKG